MKKKQKNAGKCQNIFILISSEILITIQFKKWEGTSVIKA